MLVALAAASLATSFLTMQSGRYELGERLKRTDAAWLETRDPARRSAAVEHLQRASYAFLANRRDQACEALDRACAALRGRDWLPEDALDARFLPAVIAPGTKATLRLSWSYVPSARAAISVSACGRTWRVLPGRNLDVEVDLYGSNPELRLSYEVGYAVPVHLGNSARTAYLSIVKNARGRCEALARSKVAAAQAMGREMLRALEDPSTVDFDLPYLDWLFVAERLGDGRLSVETAEELPFVRHRGTALRARFPKTPSAHETVVLAFPSVGGSEHHFFEVYGRGMAEEEAARRGWALISVRASPTAYEDAVDWLMNVRKAAKPRILAVGYGTGAGLALSGVSIGNGPAAAALFAPSLTSILKEWTTIPLFLAVGQQDAPRVVHACQTMASELRTTGRLEFAAFEPCEHAMIPAEALPKAFEFFDRLPRPSSTEYSGAVGRELK